MLSAKVLGPNAVAAVLTATTGPADLHVHAARAADPRPAARDRRPAVRARQPRGDRGLAARPARRRGTRGSGRRWRAGCSPSPRGALALRAIAPDAPALTTHARRLRRARPRPRRRLRGLDRPRHRTLKPPIRAWRRRCWRRAPSSAPRSASRSSCRSPPPAPRRSAARPQAHVAGYELGFELVAVLALVTAVSAITVRSRSPAPPASLTFMEHRQLGRSGLRVSVLGLGTMGFGGAGKFANVGELDVQAAGAPDRPLPRRRRDLRRHRQRLLAGRLGGDRRQGDPGPPRPHHARHQGALRDGRRPQRRGPLAHAHHQGVRGRACAASAPTTSTSTRCTSGTARRRSRRR